MKFLAEEKLNEEEEQEQEQEQEFEGDVEKKMIFSGLSLSKLFCLKFKLCIEKYGK